MRADASAASLYALVRTLELHLTASSTASRKPLSRSADRFEHGKRTPPPGAQTRELLDAAERLFAAKGYRGTSLEEIGREAGLSRATPGYFFRSKDGLYGAMLAQICARAQMTLAPAYAGFQPGDPPRSGSRRPGQCASRAPRERAVTRSASPMGNTQR